MLLLSLGPIDIAAIAAAIGIAAVYDDLCRLPSTLFPVLHSFPSVFRVLLVRQAGSKLQLSSHYYTSSLCSEIAAWEMNSRESSFVFFAALFMGFVFAFFSSFFFFPCALGQRTIITGGRRRRRRFAHDLSLLCANSIEKSLLFFPRSFCSYLNLICRRMCV